MLTSWRVYEKLLYVHLSCVLISLQDACKMKYLIILLILLKFAHCKIIDYNSHINVIEKIVNNETKISESCES